MTIAMSAVIIDAADVERESAFWHELLGGAITRAPHHHFIQCPGMPVVVVQWSPGSIAPDWPDGAPQQMHLDFTVDDLTAAQRTATEAGATRLRPPLGDRLHDQTGSRIYASPGGHPFCLRAA